MHLLKAYDPTNHFEPYNPAQYKRITWQWPNYAGTYYNATDYGSLGGLGAGGFSGLPTWQQVGIVGAAAAIVGYFAMARWGDSTIRPALKKVGINLSGPQRHRRRRSR